MPDCVVGAGVILSVGLFRHQNLSWAKMEKLFDVDGGVSGGAVCFGPQHLEAYCCRSSSSQFFWLVIDVQCSSKISDTLQIALLFAICVWSLTALECNLCTYKHCHGVHTNWDMLSVCISAGFICMHSYPPHSFTSFGTTA